MILTNACWSTPHSLARKGGFKTQLFSVPSEQRRISNGSFRRYTPRMGYNDRRRIRALADGNHLAKINASPEQDVVDLPRNSEEQYQLDSNRSSSGEFNKLLKALYDFTRPYTMIGTAISMISIALLPLRSFADVTPAFFVEVLKAVTVMLLGQVYGSGINQIFDVEIDKVNKPNLPLPSGAFSMEFAVAITFMSLFGCLGMGLMSRSPPLFYGPLLCCLMGSAYSFEIPFLRWKRNPYLTSLAFGVVRAVGVPLTVFLHIQKYVLGGPILFTRSLIFASSVALLFSIVVSLAKDIPDVDGDRLHGFDSTFAVKLGKNRVFWICISMIMLIYGGAIGIGAFSSSLLCKSVTVLGHFLLACIVMYRALSTDLSVGDFGLEFYMFVWKLIYAEYLIVPFVR